MGFNNHFQLMAAYNRRMNRQVYECAATLKPDRLSRDRGAFFHSILGTLNHLLVGDLLWLRRFHSHRDRYQSLGNLQQLPLPGSLDEILFEDFFALRANREIVDDLLVQWLETETREEDFAAQLSYANSKGIVSTRHFGELLSHFFNHQTHHRGQVSTLLSQQGLDIGVTDYLVDIPVLDS